MKKRIIVLIIALLILISTSTFAKEEYGTTTARQLYNSVILNGKSRNVDIYLIDNYNYIKLRDFAELINNTDKQFNVKWDSRKDSISLITNEAYQPAGGELKMGDGNNKVAFYNFPKTYYNGNPLNITGYDINGYNYFNLRELSALFDVDISFDNKDKQIKLNTSLPKATKESWIGEYKELYNISHGEITIYSPGDLDIPVLKLFADGTFEYLLNFYYDMFLIKGNWEIDKSNSDLIHLSNYKQLEQKKMTFKRNNIDKLELLISDDLLSVKNAIGLTTNNSVYKRIK